MQTCTDVCLPELHDSTCVPISLQGSATSKVQLRSSCATAKSYTEADTKIANSKAPNTADTLIATVCKLHHGFAMKRMSRVLQGSGFLRADWNVHCDKNLDNRWPQQHAPPAVLSALLVTKVKHTLSRTPPQDLPVADMVHSCPGAGICASVYKICLWTAWFWCDIVFPPGCEWQRHENGLNPSSSFQAKCGPSVIYLQIGEKQDEPWIKPRSSDLRLLTGLNVISRKEQHSSRSNLLV